MLHIRIIISFIIFLFFSINITSFSQFIKLDPQKSITQYTLKSWTIDNGLPSNALNRIIQSRDGYLWITSYGGLTRFDGINFTTYNSLNIKEIYTEGCQLVLEDKSGIIWIATQKGIVLYKNNRFFRKKSLELIDNNNIELLYADSKNNIWIGTNAEGLFKFAAGSLIYLEDFNQITNSAIDNIFEDNTGTIWIGTSIGELLKYEDNVFIPCDMHNTSGGLFSFYQDKDGTIWVGATTGVFSIKDNKLVKHNDIKIRFAASIIEDQNGMLWLISTADGLYRYNKSLHKLEHFSEINGLPSNRISKIIFDNYGNLWGCTYRNGLFQITDGKFTCYSKLEGLYSNVNAAILQYDENEFWVSNEMGTIDIIKNGQISELVTQTPIPSPIIKHMFKDSRGNVWISTYAGLLKLGKHEEKLFNVSNGFPDNYIRLTFEDLDGNIWVGTNRTGIHKFNTDGSVKSLNMSNGLSSDYVMTIIQYKPDIIIAGTKRGLNLIRNDSVIKQYKMADGLPDNLIFNIYKDKEDILWIATNTGISRLENNSFTNYSIADGLYTNTIFDILEDDSGNFWIPGPKGIMKVSKQQLNDYAAGKIDKIDYNFYDKSDGMKSSVCLGATKSLKDSKGNLWFLTAGGIAKIDPEKITINRELPPVFIEKVYTSDSTFNVQNNINIHPRYKRFYIEYTAIDLIIPEKIKFKYKLEPFENKWIEAGNKRSVSYTNIDPGNYIFKVRSTNSYGIWNENYVSIKIKILPAWYQTWLFKIALFVFIFGGIILWNQSRVNRIKRQRNILEEKVKIRTKQVVQQKKEITDSIVYSKHIQNAILPNDELIKNIFPDSFIFSKPKEIIGGDFYWVYQKNDEIVFAVADCTGHGVPGALMSMLGITFLNDIVKSKNITDPGEILDLMRIKIIRTLNQTDDPDSASDGMDIAICTIYPKQNFLKYAGANNSVIIISNKTLKELIADKMPVSYTHMLNKSFTTLEEKFKHGDLLYMYSDGYIDQFGGPEKRRFLKRNFRNTLLEVSLIPIDKQLSHTSHVFNQWKGDLDQIDDVMVIGIRL